MMGLIAKAPVISVGGSVTLGTSVISVDYSQMLCGTWGDTEIIIN